MTAQDQGVVEATAECPKCKGSGTVIDDGPNWSRSPKHRKCPVCQGTGVASTGKEMG